MSPEGEGPAGPSRPGGKGFSGPSGPAGGGPAPSDGSGGSTGSGRWRRLKARLWTPFHHTIPPFLRGLAILTVAEPFALLPFALAAHEVLPVAVVGGLVLSLPALAVFALAILWRRALGEGRTLPGLPRRLGGATGARAVGAVLLVTTVAYLLVLAFATGWWVLLAIPPAALALAAGRILISG